MIKCLFEPPAIAVLIALLLELTLAESDRDCFLLIAPGVFLNVRVVYKDLLFAVDATSLYCSFVRAQVWFAITRPFPIS